MNGNLGLALILTSLAGLSTGIGSILVLWTRSTNRPALAAAMGFSGGVMLFISFAELLPEGQSLLAGAGAPQVTALGWFFGGMVGIALLDGFIPEAGNPHSGAVVEDLAPPHHWSPLPPIRPALTEGDGALPSTLQRTALLAALGIGIHNAPEGLATFFVTLHDAALGVPVALAIALHNIPEGVAVAAAAYAATGSRTRAVRLSLLSGLSEPVGALLGYLVLRPWFSASLLGATQAAAAGVMVYIAVEQLIPSARQFTTGHHAVYGTIAGMALMAALLLLL